MCNNNVRSHNDEVKQNSDKIITTKNQEWEEKVNDLPVVIDETGIQGVIVEQEGEQTAERGDIIHGTAYYLQHRLYERFLSLVRSQKGSQSSRDLLLPLHGFCPLNVRTLFTQPTPNLSSLSPLMLPVGEKLADKRKKI